MNSYHRWVPQVSLLRPGIARTVENARNASLMRGQRLVVLNNMLPLVSAGVSGRVDRISLATRRLKTIGELCWLFRPG